mgnify:CR=1 FL=1
MSKLVIVESPAKAKTIQKYLGEGYDVVASMGHIRDLPKSKLGIDIEHGFQPDYVEIKGKEDLVQTLKKKGKKSDAIYLTLTGKERPFRGILLICLDWIWIRPTGLLLMKLPNPAFNPAWLRLVRWIWIWSMLSRPGGFWTGLSAIN